MMEALESLALIQEAVENCYRFLSKEGYNEGPRQSAVMALGRQSEAGESLKFRLFPWCPRTPDLVMNISSGFKGRWTIRK